jgi:ankyrin repeat protein
VSNELLGRLATLQVPRPVPLSNPLWDGRLSAEEANLAIYSVMRSASVPVSDAQIALRHPDAVQRLLALPSEALDPARTLDPFGRTLFHDAAAEGRADVLRFLARRGHDPLVMDAYGFTPRDHATFEYCLSGDRDQRDGLLSTIRQLDKIEDASLLELEEAHSLTPTRRRAAAPGM